MSLYKSDALILRTYKLGDADCIVVFLTRDRGKRRGVAKGARRMRSRFAGGLEPLTHARVAYFEREHRDLVRLNYVEPVTSPFASRSVEMLGHTGYFAELIDHWALEGDPSEKLFRLGSSVITAMLADVPVEKIARYFEYWLLRLQGTYPSISRCHQCDANLIDRGALLSLRDGVFMCLSCGSTDGEVELSPESLEFLQMAATIAPDRLRDAVLTPLATRELAVAHRRLISFHLDKELKSVRVLRALSAE